MCVVNEFTPIYKINGLLFMMPIICAICPVLADSSSFSQLSVNTFSYVHGFECSSTDRPSMDCHCAIEFKLSFFDVHPNPATTKPLISTKIRRKPMHAGGLLVIVQSARCSSTAELGTNSKQLIYPVYYSRAGFHRIRHCCPSWFSLEGTREVLFESPVTVISPFSLRLKYRF